MTLRTRIASHAAGSALLATLAASFAPPHATAADAPGAGFEAAPKVALPVSREVRLPNGARIILAEKHDVPLIALEGVLRGGSLTDPPGKEGAAALTAEMLRKGAGRRSAREIAAALDGAGAGLVTSAGIEFTSIAGEFMARDQALMLDLVRSLLREPAFPDSEFVKLRQQTIEALRAQKDDPQSMLSEYAAAFFYEGHPYGRPVSGDEATVARLTREDILASYRANYGGDRLILAVVGDFNSRALEAKLRSAFGDWKPAASPVPPIPPTVRHTGRSTLLVDKPDATQAYFWIGNLGVARTDPDRVPLDVVNTAFGGRFTSMINTALRIKSGLTYGARSRMARLTMPGTIAIVSYTKTESLQKAIDLALETLQSLHASGLDERTLRSATRYIAGQYPTAFETNGELAGALAQLAYFGLPTTEVTEYPARIGEVRSIAALRPIIERVYPASGDLTIVAIGNAKVILPVLRRYGPVVKTSIQEPLLTAVRGAKRSAAH
jgi:zinc protease